MIHLDDDMKSLDCRIMNNTLPINDLPLLWYPFLWGTENTATAEKCG